MPLSITVDREALDLSVKLLQSSSVARARVAVTGNGFGSAAVSDPSGSLASSTLAGKAGTAVVGTCEVTVSALRKVVDAVPAYAANVVLAVTPSVRTITGPGPSDYVDSKAEVRIIYGGSSAAVVYDPSIAAVS